MKSNFINLIFIVFCYFAGLQPTISKTKFPEEKPELNSVKAIDDFYNFYKSGDYYFGSQPSLEALRWLKSEGVSLIVNLRSEKENENFTEKSFNEENIAKELEITYTSIPVSYPDSYIPETVDEFIKALSGHKGKVFIHCASCGRVRLFFMAYLIKAKNYTVDEALAFGKQLEYKFLLENLLGKDIKMNL